jgi:hypothetical protein
MGPLEELLAASTPPPPPPEAELLPEALLTVDEADDEAEDELEDPPDEELDDPPEPDEDELPEPDVEPESATFGVFGGGCTASFGSSTSVQRDRKKNIRRFHQRRPSPEFHMTRTYKSFAVIQPLKTPVHQIHLPAGS